MLKLVHSQETPQTVPDRDVVMHSWDIVKRADGSIIACYRGELPPGNLPVGIEAAALEALVGLSTLTRELRGT